MKVLKNILLIIGALIVIGAGVMCFLNWQDIRTIFAMATQNQSQASQRNPNLRVLMTAGIAVIGGIVVGIGIAFPRQRHFKQKQVDRIVADQVQAHDVKELAAQQGDLIPSTES